MYCVAQRGYKDLTEAILIPSVYGINTKPKQERKINMKKIISIAMTLAIAAFVGCTPSEEQIKTTATAIGYAAGLVANETPIKDDARNAVVEVLNEVRSCIPAEGQSFEAAWTPVIKDKVASLVAAGKINEATGSIVISVTLIAAKGVDYLFDVRFPQAKQYANLVAAGASGAIDGFLTTFKPVNARDGNATLQHDEEAYKWLKARSSTTGCFIEP